MRKKDFVILFSVFAMTGSTIYTLARQSAKSPVTTNFEARSVAEKEFKKSDATSKVQILKIEQLTEESQFGEGWLVYHSSSIHKNKPLFISTDGSMEYVDDQLNKINDRDTASVY